MVLAAATLLGGATRLPAAVQRPDLSGHWTYNPAQSDNPRSMMQRRDSAGGDRPGGDRPGGFGGGRGGFGGGRGGVWRGGRGGRGTHTNDPQRARMRQTSDLALRPPPAPTITAPESARTFTT